MSQLRRMMVCAVGLAILVGHCQFAIAADDVAVGHNGMVVSVSPEATRVGLETLQKGGNAVDAAIAVAFALAVTWPEAGNIGGGGFMMVHPGAGESPVCIEYRETAPAAATPDMFELGETHLGHKAVGVPGTVAGMELAHERFGSLPWEEVVRPAARLAEQGFVIEEKLAAGLTSIVDRSPQFAELVRVFSPPDGRQQWRSGDRLVQPELAHTLRLIAEKGADGFYRGAVAQQLAEEMRLGGGLITEKDLANYHANAREPIHGTFRGFDVYGPPPPSSGGICLIEMLNILENFDFEESDRFSAETLHLMVESMKRGYCDRARYVGDPAFTYIPPHLTTKEYARQLAATIRSERATSSESLAPEIPLAAEGTETTHFSVVDGNGMAVANTYTLEQSYGSRVMVRGAGFLLNNEMGDFNWKPGHTDRKGNIGTEANAIAPGKRMISSQTPILVTKEGQIRVVTGSPGGRTIINTGLCIIINLMEFGMSVREAVDAPRIHHQWFPDEIRFEGMERPEFAESIKQLENMGHAFYAGSRKQGDAHTIVIEPDTGLLQGAADLRRLGAAAGH